MRLALICCAILAATAATASAGVVHDCGSLSVGPGALRHGPTNGAACFLAAYPKCRPTSYTLSSFGVDTIATDLFRLEATSSSCQVQVTGTFRVVPQRPHTTLRTFCLRVSRTANDIVATGCTGAVKTISLTGRH
jgi:hypothetical protein